jgi:hypothetical protein
MVLTESRSLAGTLRNVIIELRARIASTNGQVGGLLRKHIAPQLVCRLLGEGFSRQHNDSQCCNCRHEFEMDSPVSMAWLTNRSFAVRSRTSAGTMSPADR